MMEKRHLHFTRNCFYNHNLFNSGMLFGRVKTRLSVHVLFAMNLEYMLVFFSSC